MNNGSIRYYSIAILLFTVLLSSCVLSESNCKTSICIVVIYDSGWGIRMFVDASKSEMYSEDCKNAKSLYRLKMRELGISH